MSLATEMIDALVCGLPRRMREHRKLAMLTIFLDDSGTDGKGDICVLAGYIATVERWKAFSDAWDAELQAEPKITHLKMSDANGRHGQFRGWDDTVRDRKLERLIEIINRHVLGGIASLVGHKAYRSAAKGYLPETVDHPYWLCFNQIIHKTLEHYGQDYPNEKINFVFDTQGKGFERRAGFMTDYARQLYEASPRGDQFGMLSFASDRDMLPLQAADLLAWHIRRHSESRINQKVEDRPLVDSLSKTPIILERWLPEEISSFVDDYQQSHPLSPINRPDLH